jgi:DNA polymerase elongation subunit (family B)
MFDLISEHYDWEYEIHGGWYFKEVENTIRDKVLKMWEIAKRCPRIRKQIKYCLNSMYGKSMQKENKRFADGTLKPLLTYWSRPQFGVNVKNCGRKIIQEIVYQAVDLGFSVLYANTDSIFVSTEDAQKLVESGVVTLGTELGKFKIEREFTKFICLSQKMYWMRMKDGTEKKSFGREGEWWWEFEYEKRVRAQ